MAELANPVEVGQVYLDAEYESSVEVEDIFINEDGETQVRVEIRNRGVVSGPLIDVDTFVSRVDSGELVLESEGM